MMYCYSVSKFATGQGGSEPVGERVAGERERPAIAHAIGVRVHNKIISGISVELNKAAANELRQTMTDEAGEGRRRKEETRGGSSSGFQEAAAETRDERERRRRRHSFLLLL